MTIRKILNRNDINDISKLTLRGVSMGRIKSFISKLKPLAITAAALVITFDSAEAKVVLINVFEVPQGKVRETIKMWEEAREFLQTQPGYISTNLHESLDDSARFKFINVAEWENAESFQNATEAMKKSGKVKLVEGVRGNPSLYKIIRSDN